VFLHRLPNLRSPPAESAGRSARPISIIGGCVLAPSSNLVFQKIQKCVFFWLKYCFLVFCSLPLVLEGPEGRQIGDLDHSKNKRTTASCARPLLALGARILGAGGGASMNLVLRVRLMGALARLIGTGGASYGRWWRRYLLECIKETPKPTKNIAKFTKKSIKTIKIHQNASNTQQNALKSIKNNQNASKSTKKKHSKMVQKPSQKIKNNQNASETIKNTNVH